MSHFKLKALLSIFVISCTPASTWAFTRGFKPISGPQRFRLTAPQSRVLKHYNGDGRIGMNAWLKQQPRQPYYPDKKWDQSTALLDSAIKNLPRTSAPVVFRGEMRSQKLVHEFTPGTTFTMKTYTHASKTRTPGNLQFIITNPWSGKEIPAHLVGDSRETVIFPRGVRYKVLETFSSPDRTDVFVEPQTPDST